ncbi:MAG: sugar phosphate nucleotidyltransferase [Saprospiraceae bacterium]|jgi:glucose-1-phosphate thymidylyltransferase
MKAVIPVAGAGLRLRPHTYTQPKPLIPVAGKAIIAFIVEELERAGVQEFVFIIGYLGDKIRSFLDAQYPDLHKEFVVQNEPQGLGHAIWSARENILQTDEIIIVLGDTIFDVDLRQFLGLPYSGLGVKVVDDPREFGVLEMGQDGFVSRVVEKPNIPKSNLALVGLYKIQEPTLLIDCLDGNIASDFRTHGEFQLTDGLMCMIEKGVRFSPFTVNNWFDCGKKEILLETNATLLAKRSHVHVGEHEFERSIIIQPVAIGNGCQISDSIVGPNVTIGDNARIHRSIVQDSIIGNYASIEEVVLKQSIVGSDASVKGLSQSLNIGDNTEIDFN